MPPYGQHMCARVRLAVALCVCGTLLGLAHIPAHAADGQVLASTRGQVAWLDLSAPRPRPITALQLPSYPADVTAVSGAPVAVASIESTFHGTGPMGTDLVTIDLQSGTMKPLLSRQSSDELLDAPVMLPDGGSVLFQRTVHGTNPGIRVEQVDLDGHRTGLVIDDARYPAPSPDASRVVFVRYVDQHAELVSRSLADDSEAPVFSDDRFIALTYPRFSPDGQTIAFVGISLLGAAGELREANAHGIPWEVWLVQFDGSDLRQIPDVVNDDPSVAWSPDGTQLLVYGGWGSYLIDPVSGESTLLSFLPGYGALAWVAN
jgi:Tol biopolymer transport system component